MIGYEKLVVICIFGQYYLEESGKWKECNYHQAIERINKYHTTGV